MAEQNEDGPFARDTVISQEQSDIVLDPWGEADDAVLQVMRPDSNDPNAPPAHGSPVRGALQHARGAAPLPLDPQSVEPVVPAQSKLKDSPPRPRSSKERMRHDSSSQAPSQTGSAASSPVRYATPTQSGNTSVRISEPGSPPASVGGRLGREASTHRDSSRTAGQLRPMGPAQRVLLRRAYLAAQANVLDLELGDDVTEWTVQSIELCLMATHDAVLSEAGMRGLPAVPMSPKMLLQMEPVETERTWRGSQVLPARPELEYRFWQWCCTPPPLGPPPPWTPLPPNNTPFKLQKNQETFRKKIFNFARYCRLISSIEGQRPTSVGGPWVVASFSHSFQAPMEKFLKVNVKLPVPVETGALISAIQFFRYEDRLSGKKKLQSHNLAQKAAASLLAFQPQSQSRAVIHEATRQADSGDRILPFVLKHTCETPV